MLVKGLELVAVIIGVVTIIGEETKFKEAMKKLEGAMKNIEGVGLNIRGAMKNPRDIIVGKRIRISSGNQ
ncbi:hypothetical protein SBF1_3320003 [Candidatus Desulfosporosinus infrequens]|uniref:Uncharacterized protein n=1 Tax=Candidatus Desulfosporosinus infrequens TaxID=2043169 RepID=A0A2U3L0N6_9FIRM|nr:hypothetical protein SBF1_3320003 [Candidatus Desulfosporosinus infrequens]